MEQQEPATQDQAEKAPSLKTPSPLAVFRELKVIFELIALLTLRRWISSGAPTGDGHTIIVYPGFGHSNKATRMLRRFLIDLGYNAIPCAMERNTGLSEETSRLLHRQLEHEYKLTGKPVSLLGWSLGGIYARMLAGETPEFVRQVITLASPFKAADIEEPGRFAQALIGPLEALDSADLKAFRGKFVEAPPIPSTSIFSKGDHIVSPDCCIDRTGPRTENIRTWGSHSGMVFNSFVFALVANRLSEPLEQWAPFSAEGWFRKFAFPIVH